MTFGEKKLWHRQTLACFGGNRHLIELLEGRAHLAIRLVLQPVNNTVGLQAVWCTTNATDEVVMLFC